MKPAPDWFEAVRRGNAWEDHEPRRPDIGTAHALREALRNSTSPARHAPAKPSLTRWLRRCWGRIA